MRIYELEYRNDDRADGYARDYFTSMKQANKRLAELKAEHAAEILEYQKKQKLEVYPNPFPDWEPPIRVDYLDFEGTPRQMVIKALEYGDR